MKIQVTAEHIRQGTRECPSSCPIALALQANGFIDVEVARVIQFRTRDTTLYALWPGFIVEEFIRRYDNDDSVRPFEFDTATLATAPHRGAWRGMEAANKYDHDRKRVEADKQIKD